MTGAIASGQLEYGRAITLYEIDTTVIQGTTKHRFCQDQHINRIVRFRGNVYVPHHFEVEGFETTGQGVQARPVLRLSNVGHYTGGITREARALAGALFKRTRTKVEYLDDEVHADSAQVLEDFYFIEGISMHSPLMSELTLSPATNVEGVDAPNRLMTRGSCGWKRYRVWDGSAFDYTDVNECPYTGDDYFNEYDEPVFDPDEDRCSRSLEGCKLRKVSWAFGGFPGMKPY